MITSPYTVGAIDIRWDNPKLLPQNSGLQILGVNVYRSTDNPYGPYVKCNDIPVSVLFYRDQTIEAQVIDEDATPTLKFNMEPTNISTGRWLVYSKNKPIVIPGRNGEFTTRIQDVQVKIDNGDGTFLVMPAFSVDGVSGQIELISSSIFNNDLNQIIPPRLPIPPNGKVHISYNYIKNQVLTVLSQRIYYKATTVAVDPNDNSKTLETPLEEISERSPLDIEAIDYIWREAVLRNRYILEQGGERVKLFIRKTMGQTCPSHQVNYGQSYNDCLQCFGSNIMGGFSGPYDIIIAPPETEKSVMLADMGLHITYDWTTWMTDWPLLNERDVIVRQNNERYVVGAVNPQGLRGTILQQHFTMSYIDVGDIRYKINVEGAEDGPSPSWDRYRTETPPVPASPEMPLKPTVDPAKIIRGKSVTFENVMYALLISLLGISTLGMSFIHNIIENSFIT
jgi:hypothetical protein